MQKKLRSEHKAIILALLAGIIFIAAACSKDDQKAAPPPLVTATTLTAQDVIYTGEYMGQVQGFKSADVLSRVQGVILKRLYIEGDYVNEGQPLFAIEPDSYEGSLQQAEGNLAQARARFTNASENLKRILPLFEKNAVSQRDRDAAQAEYDAAKAQVEAARGALKVARVEMGYTTVVSPVSGFSSKETMTPGNIVYDGSKLTIVNMVDPLYVNFAIAAPAFLKLNTMIAEGRAVNHSPDGRPATITLIDGSTFAQSGKVTFIDSLVDPMLGVVRARATFPNPEHKVMPGQFVRIKVELAMLVQAVMIPKKAVLQTQEGATVYVLDKNNVASTRKIYFSIEQGQDYLIDSGLSAGERIVVDGINKVVPNKPVTLAEQNVAPGDTAQQNGSAVQSPPANPSENNSAAPSSQADVSEQ